MGKLMLNGDVVGGGVSNARMTSFDNRENGFAADNVQAAIEEASKMGGNSTDVELTLAEYEALGDKVNSDNVTYFITDDNESTENLNNMRYNPETDTVEIYYNDEWHEWKAGNLQTVYIYKDGEIVEGLDTENYTWSAYTKTTIKIDVSSILCSIPARSNGVRQAILGTNEAIDLSNYQTLGIEYTYNGTTYTKEISIASVSSGYIYFGLVSPNTTYLNAVLGVSSSKETVNTNKYVGESIQYTLSPTGSKIDLYINKVWVK